MNNLSDGSVRTPLFQPLGPPSSSGSRTPGGHLTVLESFFKSPASPLPVALLSALALAATSATQIYTYANIICKDAHQCNDSESRRFAASVAIATTIACIISLFSVKAFEALCKRRTRVGLAIWLVVRSLSVLALALGGLTGNIGIAMSCQIFEGIASDNILHFNLNSLYVRAHNSARASALIGGSLALYMIGISLSPAIAGMLGDFRYSFIMAYGLFIAAFFYLMVAVRVPPSRAFTVPNHSTNQHTGELEATSPDPAPWLAQLATAPICFITADYWRLLPGLALFFYNAAQSYTFSALMVYTSITFQFSSRENGFLLTIVHAVASVYLLTVFFLVPKALAWLRSNGRRINQSPCESPGAEAIERADRARNASLAIASALIQAAALVLVAIARQPWQVYFISAFLAFGLAFPGFLKSYFAASFEAASKPQSLAYLVIMESCGGLLAPVMLGGFQTAFTGGGVFVMGACSIGIAGILLLLAVCLDRSM